MCPQAGQSLANFAVEAIRSGDIDGLKQALEKDRDLVYAAIDGKRTLLHVATDWPGHFPNNAASVAVLIASGADVNATFVGSHSETPLHGGCNRGQRNNSDRRNRQAHHETSPFPAPPVATPIWRFGDRCFGEHHEDDASMLL